MATPARLACFDLDNTLIDRQRAYRAWAAHFCAGRGLGDEAVALLVALDEDGFAPREAVFGPARERLGLDEPVEELIARYRAEYPRFIAPAGEVARALAELRAAGWKVALVTNGPPSQRAKLERAGLAGCFDASCISEELGVEKPNRAIFAAAALRCGIALGAGGICFMVGDAPAIDVGGARAAGMRTIWMRRGRRWLLSTFRPDLTAESPIEAVRLLLAEAWR